MSRTPRFARRLGWLAAVAAIIAAVGVPLAASASPSGHGPSAGSAAARGVMFGGVTPQGWPVAIELKKNHRRVVRAVFGFDMRCTSGDVISAWSRFNDLAVSTKRRFRGSFGPSTNRYDDGTTSDWEGSMSGRVNRGGSKMSGSSQLTATFYDNAAAVTDTCSGSVKWTAKQ
jgi:hypothetical protein